MMEARLDAAAAALHADAVIVDGVNPSVPTRELLGRMCAAGVTAVNVTLAIHENQTEAARALVFWDRFLAANDDLVRPILTVADVRAAKSEGRVGIIYGFQNGSPFEDELDFVALFARLGIRIVQPAYMTQSLIGAGCLEPRDSGLSAFGRDVVHELNDCGVAIDLSHCGPRTTLEAIETSSKPVLFTHANARTLVDNPRNKSDEALLALAAKGGVVGTVAFRSFLAPATREVTLDDLLDQVDYLVELLGADHVGVGTDFTEGRPEGFLERAFGRNAPPGITPAWPWMGPEGFRTVDEFPNVTAGLLARGYDEVTVRKILGENFLRALEAAWTPRHTPSTERS
jgi:membrane dipeptidase